MANGSTANLQAYADNTAMRAAQQYGIDPNTMRAIFHAQINQESGFNPTAQSGAGAQGIAQIVPKWHPGVNPYDAKASLDYAANWDAKLYKKYGNWNDVLSTYNSGRPWQVGQGIGETNNYVTKILAAANQPGASAKTKLAAAKLVGGGQAPGIAPNVTDNRAGLLQYLMGNLNSYAQTGVASNPQGLMALIGSRQQGSPSPSPSPTPASRPSMPTQGSTTPYKGGTTVGWLEQFANPYGLTVTSTTGDKHATHSYHYQGRAVDFGGDPTKMAALAKSALSKAGDFKEFIYTGPGNPGYSILNGKVIPNSQLDKHLYDEHTNHVHLAR